MAEDFRITGAGAFKDLSRRLKEQGTYGKQLRRELNKGILEALEPMIDEVHRAEESQLPKRGGLAALVASQRITRSTSGTGVGIRQSARDIRRLKALDRGEFRHPTFGHLPWVPQSIAPGVWSKTLDSSKNIAAVRARIQRVMKEVADKIEKD